MAQAAPTKLARGNVALAHARLAQLARAERRPELESAATQRALELAHSLLREVPDALVSGRARWLRRRRSAS